MAKNTKDIIRVILEDYVNERFIRSEKPDEERYSIVANKIIEFMDNMRTTYIPDYRTLQDWKPEPTDTFRPNMKYLLQKYLRRNEYDSHVKPLIQSLRPEFTYTKGKGKKHRVDDFVVVYSNGEKIVYNTFKMNGITLIFEDPRFEFEYELDGEIKTKRPDFYWPSNDELIEVAGFEEETYNKNYIKKLESSKSQLEKMGQKITILDYFHYRKNLQGFYKYVCEKFGFPYDPMDFWTVNISQGIDVDELKREAEELIKKGSSKTFGERWRQNKIITQVLTKQSQGDFFDKPVGYESVWDYKRETGIGMRWNDPELRKQVQTAWCLSSGSNRKTYEKFKELYKDIKLSKTTVEVMKQKFPDDFNMDNREQICGDTSTQVNEGFTDYILKKLGKYPFHEYQKAVNNFLDIQNFKVKIWDTYDDLRQRQVMIYKDNEHLPVIKIRKSLNKDNKWKKVALIDNELLRKMERYIPSKGLVSCVLEWVKNKTGEKNIDEFELF